MGNKIIHSTIMQKSDSGDKIVIYPKTTASDIIDGSTTLDKTLETLKASNISNKTTEFQQAETRENLVSGETISQSHGKIMKLISDLKLLAYSDKVGVSNLDPVLTTAYNNRVTTDKVTTSTTITSGGYVADARAVNNLQNQINDITKNLSNYWCLNGGTYIGPNTNLDDIKAIGSYYNHNDIQSTSIINNPANTAFTMQIYASNGEAAWYITQELRAIYLDGGIYIRKFDLYSKKWTKWEKSLSERDLIAKQYPATLLNGWTNPYGDNHLITYKIGNLYLLTGVIRSPSVITEDTYSVANLNLPFNFSGQGCVNIGIQTNSRLYLTSYNDNILHDQYCQTVINTEYMIKGFFIH